MLIPLLILASVPTLSTPAHASPSWSVAVGAQSADGSVQGMGYYPNVITIDAGDTVQWTLNTTLPHTVSFCAPASPCPSAVSAQAMAPTGGDTYSGTGFVSSGLLYPGQTYSLTFPTSGTYVYQSLVNEGMEGVVVVQGQFAAYPHLQSYYTAQGQLQQERDLMAGIASPLTTQSTAAGKASGAAVFHVAVGAGTAEAALVPITPFGMASYVTQPNGTARFLYEGSDTFLVNVTLSGLYPGGTHEVDIHLGVCGADGGAAFSLGTVTTSNATVTPGSPTLTTLDTTLTGVSALPEAGWSVQVHQGVAPTGLDATVIACGNLTYANAAYERFIPTSLVIGAGDTVAWTQPSPQDMHTVTFVPPGMAIPAYPSQAAFTPEGNGTAYSASGYYNSGVMALGQTYALNFPTPGVYQYFCLAHYGIGMVGSIVVLPGSTSTNQSSQISSISGQVANQGSQISSISGQVANQGSQIASAETTVTEVQSSLSQLQSTAAKQSDLSTLSSSVNSLQSTIVQQSASFSGQVSSISGQVASATDIAYSALAVAFLLGAVAIAMARRRPK